MQQSNLSKGSPSLLSMQRRKRMQFYWFGSFEHRKWSFFRTKTMQHLVTSRSMLHLFQQRWAYQLNSIVELSEKTLECLNCLLDQRMYRGCLSDQNSRLICDREYVNVTGICVKCPESNCNSMPKSTAPTLSCVKCAGNEQCAFGQNPKNLAKCKNAVLFGINESCFIRYNSGEILFKFLLFETFCVALKSMFSLFVDEDTGQTLRGCTIDAKKDPNWCNKTDDCEMCSGDACNIKNVQFQYCVHCNSKIDKNCANLGDSYDYVISCGGAPYSYKERGCFTLNQSKWFCSLLDQNFIRKFFEF